MRDRGKAALREGAVSGRKQMLLTVVSTDGNSISVTPATQFFAPESHVDKP
jgi:hypothetical protein